MFDESVQKQNEVFNVFKSSHEEGKLVFAS